MIHHMMVAAAGGQSQLLMNVLTTLGLTTNLELCLDAADTQSYSSGQKWLDRSGNGVDFFLGADINASTDDPTLTGAPGAPTTYWLFDGGDFFRYDSTNETWMENLHKDNAVFTFVAFIYQDDAGDDTEIFGTNGEASSNVGISWESNNGVITVKVADGSGSLALNPLGDTTLSATSWHMVGLSLNEAGGASGSFLYADGAYNQVSASDTFDGAYATPSASNATFTAEIGATGNATTVSDAGQRIACIAVWEGTALTKANMDSIWSAMRGRFGL